MRSLYTVTRRQIPPDLGLTAKKPMTWLEKRDAFFAGVRQRPLVMGILNVTPDSFSDGGRFASKDNAVGRAKAMATEGADILDVGGESTRPGANPVSAEDELDRVLPVVHALSTLDVPISIDTYKARTARAAVSAGAVVVLSLIHI